jgi:hypothetical protein
MVLRLPARLRLATAFATLLGLLGGGDVRAASKIKIAAIGDRAPGGGQFLGPSLTGTPAAGGNGWVAFRTLVTSGGTSEQIVAKNMIGAVSANASTFVVAEIGKSAGKVDDKDLGSFKQFLGRPAINANGDVVFVATLSNSDRLPGDVTLAIPAGVFLYRRAVPGREARLSVVALARDDVPGIGTLDFGTTIDILSGSLTAIDVPERTPALNDAGDVAFTAAIATAGGNIAGAVFLAPQGFHPTPVVRLGDQVDGAAFTVVGPPALNNGGTIAFRGLLDDVVDGVFEYSQGITTPLVTTGRVVITTEPFPFAQVLFDFGEVVALNDRGDVAFTAGPLFDGTLESTDLEGAPGVFVLHDGDLSIPGYPGRPVVGRGRITDVTLGPDGGNDVAPPALTADGTLIFFGELNSGRQQALFRVAPPYNSVVLTSWITLGGADPTPSPIQGTYQAASSAPVIDAAGNVTFFARIAGSVTSEGLLFLPPGGGAQYVLVGQATPTKGLFGGPPFSGLVLTDAGDVYFKSFVAAGPSGLGLFHWHPTGNGKGDTSLVVRTGDAAPLDGAPRFTDLVGDPSVNANGDVAFAALVGDGVGRAVFAVRGGVVTPIALPNQDIPSPPAPPASGFRSIAAAPMMLVDGSVVFRGTYDYPDPLLPFSFVVEDGVFVSDPGGGLRLLTHSGEDSPVEGVPFFRFRDTSVSSGGSIAFRSTLGTEFDLEPPLGLFVIDPSATIRAIAVAGRTLADGQPHVSTLSGRPAIDAAGNVAFLGDVIANQRAGTAVVRSGADGTVSILAQVGGSGPQGGLVKSLSRPTMSANGHIAYRASFEAGTGGTSGFFLSTETGTTPFVVVGESDADGEGGRFSSLNPGGQLNTSDVLAFVGSASQGKSRNGIFLASPSTMTAQALSGRIKPISLKDEELKPRDTLRGRVILETSGLADGFDLTKDAVTIAVADKGTSYFSVTIPPNKLAHQGDSWVLRRRQSKLKKLRIRAKRGTVRATFAAGGLDFLLASPPFTIRLSVGNDGGVVTVPCTAGDDRITCSPS